MPATDRESPVRNSLDRAGLGKILNGYLDALIARDPSSIKVAPNLKCTENAEIIALGEGLWRSASKLRTGTRLDFIDPVNGQAGSQLVIEESGKPCIVQIRLKVVAGLITEVESVAIHEGDLKYFDAEGMKPVPVFHEIIPPSQRMSREKLVETVKLYINLLKVGSFKECGTRLHRNMVRWENGVVTSDYERLSTREGGPKRAAIPARFPIIDEEYGLVYAPLEFGLAERTLCPFELFKIMNDEIVMLHIVIKQMSTRPWAADHDLAG